MIKQRGKTWWYNRRHGGERVRLSLYTEIESIAAMRAGEIEQAITLGKPLPSYGAIKPVHPKPVGGTPTGKTLGQLFDICWTTHWREKKDSSGIRERWGVLSRFIVPTTDVSTIDAGRLSQLVIDMKTTPYKRGPGGADRYYSQASINRVLSLLGYMLNRAAELDYIVKVPKLPQVKEHARTRWLTSEEQVKLFEALSTTQSFDFFVVLLDTGCRLSEVWQLTWDAIRLFTDGSGGTITLRDTKSHADVTKPITKRVARILFGSQYRNHTGPFVHLSEKRFRKDWEAAKKAAGLDDQTLVIHSLRHTTASRLVQNGVDLRRVQAYLGHKSLNTTLRYSHLSTEHLQGAIDVLDNV